MNTLPAPVIAILDLGTFQTTLLQARLVEGFLQYLDHVTVPTRGVRKGAVISLTAAAETIRQAANTLEGRTGVPVERVFLSLTGSHVTGMGSQAGIALTSRSREITRQDAHRVLDLARSIQLPEDRQILHVVPQEFVLDRQAGIHEPVGMLAARLEARVFLVTAAAGVKDNLVLAANQAGVEVQELIFAPLAAAEACLSAEERQAGVALVDLGAGSTGIVVYSQGALVHASAIPVGGDHFTSDIAARLSTPPEEAERIKQEYGAVTSDLAGVSSTIEVPGVAGQPPRWIGMRELCDCVAARAQELADLIARELERAGRPSAGLVIVGGGSRLQGLTALLSSRMRLPLRLAAPALIAGMPAALAEPEFAFCAGACFYAHRLLAHQHAPESFWQKLRQRWDAFA